jgi:hypothetical protein
MRRLGRVLPFEKDAMSAARGWAGWRTPRAGIISWSDLPIAGCTHEELSADLPIAARRAKQWSERMRKSARHTSPYLLTEVPW